MTIKRDGDNLVVSPYPEYTSDQFHYYVITPEQEVMNFYTKTEAQKFIDFYHRYKEKYPERF